MAHGLLNVPTGLTSKGRPPVADALACAFAAAGAANESRVSEKVVARPSMLEFMVPDLHSRIDARLL